MHNAAMKISELVCRLVVGLSLATFFTACTQDSKPVVFEPTLKPLGSPGVAGSMAPYLARGPHGSIVMSWLEPRDEDHLLQYAMLEEDGWGAPRTVARGDNWFVNWADFPSVVPLSDDVWGAHWLVRQEAGGYAYDVNVVISHDQGKTWSKPVPAHSDNTETEHGFVSFYPLDGGVGFIYLDGRKQVNEYTEDPNTTGMTLRAAMLTDEGALAGEQLVDSLICDCCQTDVAMTDEGPIAVYRNRTEKEIRDIYVTRRVDGQWLEGRPVNEDNWEIYGCPVNGPEIFARGSDVAIAWFSGSNDMPKVQLVRSSDSGKTFSEPLLVSGSKPLGHVGMTLDSENNAWVTWHASAGEGLVEIKLRRVSAVNVLGPIHTLVAKGDVTSFSVPQITADENNLIVAWTEGGYGETRIVTAAIELPPRR